MDLNDIFDLCYPFNIWCYYIYGYFYSVFLSHIPVKYSIERLRKESVNSNNDDKNGNNSAEGDVRTAIVVGLVERAVYTTFILINSPEFIALWLGLKVAGQWGAWARSSQAKTGEDGKALEAEIGKKFIIYGEDIYNIYIIGCGLSVLYAIVGAVAILKFIEGKFIFLILSIALLFVPPIFFIMIKLERKILSFLP